LKYIIIIIIIIIIIDMGVEISLKDTVAGSHPSKECNPDRILDLVDG